LERSNKQLPKILRNSVYTQANTRQWILKLQQANLSVRRNKAADVFILCGQDNKRKIEEMRICYPSSGALNPVFDVTPAEISQQ
jgi:methylthioribose-1-phosphate isomerase